MVRAAQQYARAHFHTEAANAYMAVLLRGYARLLRYKPQLDAAYRRGRVTMPAAHFHPWVERTGLKVCPHWRHA